jgi:hypothetical protein
MKRNKILFFSIFFLFAYSISSAYVSESTNFKIESDVMSYGGGVSASTNFSIQDSLSDRQLNLDDSASYQINSGPLPMWESSIVMSVVPNLTLSGKVSSLRGGTANGSVSVTVTTDNPGGYELKLSGTALSSGSNNFSSFSGPAAWSVADGASAFGFSTSTNVNWHGVGLAPVVIDKRISNNQPFGTATTINFRAESKKINQSQPAGGYNATITLTALPL